MAAYSSHHWFPASNSSGSTSPAHLLVVASSLRLGKHCRDLYSANLHVVFHPPASSSDGYSLDQKRDFACRKRYSSKSFSFLEKLSDSFSASCSSCFSFFTGKEFGRGYVNEGRMQIRNSGGKPVNGRMLTNVLLVVNVLVYAAQIATQGKLLLWGAKVNSLIDKGQLWRLATSALLHANIGHLMINCYSLNSVGPTVEKMSGSRRFLAIYFSSAIASSVMSYRFSQSPSVGASGAIFGLVGSYAVFVLRHRKLVGGAKEDLLHVAHVIALNMVIGFLSRGIDNWGHLGGLLGGAAVSWFLGPAWHMSRMADGKVVLADRAPIYQFINRRRLS
ncbi:RHOMBOID-like protein 10, chloroplastic [Zingiber officinale]|uniref:RHOMBOID-like protein 10, chloroplastic n=1 Tax=Zingiber officinale TaxID=94328 RepID=UPI001C4D5FFB|nr:RHOMBOID-like protein 10, chloroplastic [Zingiber officinale]XP_042406406.1 RHOMBOID-like protein 10, chloroplastic [Zingiber officinale]